MEILITSDIASTTEQMQQAIARIIENSEPILLAGASSILALVHDRIHGEGRRANGADLGTYSNSYMKVRAKNNRTQSRQVIASLTRQMENDFTVVAVNDVVGLGFQNPFNGQKAQYIEKMYPGTYYISEREEQVFVQQISQSIDDLFK